MLLKCLASSYACFFTFRHMWHSSRAVSMQCSAHVTRRCRRSGSAKYHNFSSLRLVIHQSKDRLYDLSAGDNQIVQVLTRLASPSSTHRASASSISCRSSYLTFRSSFRTLILTPGHRLLHPPTNQLQPPAAFCPASPSSCKATCAKQRNTTASTNRDYSPSRWNIENDADWLDRAIALDLEDPALATVSDEAAASGG
jgi:hypothetical protein